MNSEETVKLCRVVAAACPQQAMDEYTPDAWHPLLKDLGFGDCQAAVIAVGKRQPFIAPAEIRAEVTRIRNDRVERAFIEAPPHELTNDTRAYQRALQARTRQAADGALPSVHDHLAIAGPGDGPAEIEGPREASRPKALSDALEDLKAKLGPARARTAPLASPQEIARRKAAESRAAREAAEREQSEGSQAS